MAKQYEINNLCSRTLSFKKEEKSSGNALDLLKNWCDLKEPYQVIAHFDNELKMGWFINKGEGKHELTFADLTDRIEDEYLQQLRAFNKSEEVLIKKIGANKTGECRFWVRKINDTFGESIETIDSTSTIYGKRVENSTLQKNFVSVYEPGRKIKLVLPVEEKTEKYSLTTRSYIVYDNITCQAGYKYYRYVAIKAERMD